jgi:hypothetical protein
MEHDRTFRLEITTLEDFLAFVAVLRGVDEATLADLAQRLTQKTAALQAAIEGASDAQPHP